MFELAIGNWRLLEIFWFFVIAAFIGWLLEVFYAYYKDRRLVNRGFLFGPFCPIYGFGSLLILALFLIVPFPLGRPSGPAGFLAVFVIITAATAFLEFLTGWLLEKIFQQRWWDYSDCRWNLRGFICARFSLYWGLAGTGLYLLLSGLEIREGIRIESPWMNYAAYILLVYFIADVTKSVDLAFRLKIFLDDLADAAYDLRGKVRDLNLGQLDLEAIIQRGRIDEYISEISQRLDTLKDETRKTVEMAIHRYASLLRRENIRPFRHFLQAFPRLKYPRMEDALDILRERFFLSRFLRKMERSWYKRSEEPRVGRYMESPHLPKPKNNFETFLAKQLVTFDDYGSDWTMQIVEVDPGSYFSRENRSRPLLYIVMEGKAVVSIDSHEKILEKGHYVFVPDENPVQIRNAGENKLVILKMLSGDNGLDAE